MAEITAVELLDRYETGERDFRRLDLSGLQFNPRGIGRRKITVTGADFSEANMSKCGIMYQQLSGGIFINVDFTGTTFDDTRIRDCDMSFANFTGANIAENPLKGVNLEGANFTEAIFFQSGISKCNLTGAIFRRAKLEESGPADGKLTRVDFTGARMFDLDIGRRSVIFDQTIMPDGSIRTDTP